MEADWGGGGGVALGVEQHTGAAGKARAWSLWGAPRVGYMQHTPAHTHTHTHIHTHTPAHTHTHTNTLTRTHTHTHRQVIVSLAEKGDMGALMAYTGQTGGALNYMQLLQQLMMNNPTGAVSLAKMVAKQVRAWRVDTMAGGGGLASLPCLLGEVQPLLSGGVRKRVHAAQVARRRPGFPRPAPAPRQTPPPAGCDTNTIADLFLQRNMVREATAFLLDALAGEGGLCVFFGAANAEGRRSGRAGGPG